MQIEKQHKTYLFGILTLITSFRVSSFRTFTSLIQMRQKHKEPNDKPPSLASI